MLDDRRAVVAPAVLPPPVNNDDERRADDDGGEGAKRLFACVDAFAPTRTVEDDGTKIATKICAGDEATPSAGQVVRSGMLHEATTQQSLSIHR